MEDLYLYHFTSEGSLISILKDKCFNFSNIKNTNDPCESREILFTLPTFEYDMISPDQFWEYQTEFSDSIREKLFNASFVIDTDFCNAYEHQRMWAQYGEKSKGVVLKFNRLIFLERVKEIIQMKPNAKFLDSKAIKYDTNFKPNSACLALKQLAEESMQEIASNVLENYTDLFFTKNKDWEHECEFRILLKSLDSVSVNIDGCLIEVIKGLDFNEDIVFHKLTSEFIKTPIIGKMEYCNGKLHVIKPGAIFSGEFYSGENF